MINYKPALRRKLAQIYNWIRSLLYSCGVYLCKFENKGTEEILYVLNQLRAKPSSLKMARYGGPNDGGYVLPMLIEQCRFCISPGVGPTSKFEQHLEKYGIPSLLMDGSVERPPNALERGIFLRKYLGTVDTDKSITLESAVAEASKAFNFTESCGGVLQIDIEGAEIGCVLTAPHHILKRFDIVCLELHHLDRLVFHDYRVSVSALLEKLSTHFDLVHIHPNNCCGQVVLAGNRLPRVVELSFVAKHLNVPKSNEIGAGRPFDDRCVLENPEIYLDQWWFDCIKK